MSDKAINRSFLIRQLVIILEEFGIAEERFLNQCNIKDIDKCEESDFPKIFESAYTLCDDKSFMVTLGQRIDLSYFGSLGFALMSCSNLSEALKLLQRYKLLSGQGLNYQVINSDDSGTLIRIRVDVGNDLLKKLITELVISQFLYIGRVIADIDIPGIEVRFSHLGVKNTKRYESILRTKVLFNHLHSEIYFPININNLELKGRDSAVNMIFQEQCEELLRGLNSVENFSAATRRILLHNGDHFPDIEYVAKELHISESTLRRRLKDESSSYRIICDEVRNLLAKKYLTTTNLTISEIAILLNYSEPASFRRAFVRWNSSNPNDYRDSKS